MPQEKCAWIPSCFGFLTFGCTKAHSIWLIMQGLFFAQVMTHRKGHVKKKALNNELMTYDTFMLPYDVRNLTKKKIMSYGKNTLRTPLMLKCEFWKTLIQFSIVSNMPLWTSIYQLKMTHCSC